MTSVERDHSVTYIIENKALNNPYTEYKTVTRTIKIHSHQNFID